MQRRVVSQKFHSFYRITFVGLGCNAMDKVQWGAGEGRVRITSYGEEIQYV